MIKIGNTIVDTYPLSKCNLKNLCENIYPVPMDYHICPICGEKLKIDYSYAIRVSDGECVKIKGKECTKCNSFFSKYRNVLHYIEKHPYEVQPFVIIHDYDCYFDDTLFNSSYRKKTAFLQYVISIPHKTICCTLVLAPEDADESHNVFCFSSKLGIAILKAEETSSNFVELDDGVYRVLLKRKKEHYYHDNKYDIVSTLGNLPDLSTEQTLYVYNGNIECHSRHHIETYRAWIESFNQEIGFYVDYCFECNQFLMKYSDYRAYLKRYKFFPMKINYPRDSFGLYSRAETSPLFDNGYSVSQEAGLSDNDRHDILAFMIDYGIMSRRNILDYLDTFINTNGKAEHNSIALSKWENDKDYVLNYRLLEKPLVNIGRIERRKTRIQK